MTRWTLKIKTAVLICTIAFSFLIALLGLFSFQIRTEALRAITIEIDRTRRTFDREQDQLSKALLAQGRVIANVPLIGATLDTHDPATVRGVLENYRSLLGLDLYQAADAKGRVLGTLRPSSEVGSPEPQPNTDPAAYRPGTESAPFQAVHRALSNRSETAGYYSDGIELFQCATVPVVIGGETRGTLTVGAQVNDSLARSIKAVADCDVSFTVNGRVIASTLDRAARPGLASWLERTIRSAPKSRDGLLDIREGDLLSEVVPLHSADINGTGFIVVQQSLISALASYRRLLAGLLLAGLFALIVAVAGSVVLAESVTGSILSISRAARALSAGDWNQRVKVRSRDELRDLGDAFNQMADRLQRWDEALREEVGTRTAELNSALAQLDQAYQRMRGFNADAAHELLTPLTIIRGELEVSLRIERSPGEYRRVMNTVLDETLRLTRIVEQLLAMARADAGEVQLRLDRVQLATVLNDICIQMRIVANEKGIDVRVGAESDVTITADEDLLRQLFLNLIDNAVKYIPRGGWVEVKERVEGDSVRIDVRDSGPGIDADQLPHIFDRFYRVDKARSRSMGGSGLGLSICKWIAEAHNGRIGVESQLGTGSTFSIVLPLLESQSPLPVSSFS